PLDEVHGLLGGGRDGAVPARGAGGDLVGLRDRVLRARHHRVVVDDRLAERVDRAPVRVGRGGGVAGEVERRAGVERHAVLRGGRGGGGEGGGGLGSGSRRGRGGLGRGGRGSGGGLGRHGGGLPGRGGGRGVRQRRGILARQREVDAERLLGLRQRLEPRRV